MQGYDKYLGRQWNGNDDEKEKVDDLLNIAANMGKKLGVPVYIGEFGAYGKADHASRVRWTDYIARACETRGMLWAYWDFSAGFAVYDSALNQYDEGLLNALIPQ
jgi:endoglucanase